jgi:hypothetical protein
MKTGQHTFYKVGSDGNDNEILSEVTAMLIW